MCPTNEIEQEIKEAEEINCGIVEIHTKLEGYLSAAKVKEKKTDEVKEKSVDSDKVNVVNETCVKPKLPKIMLPRFSGEIMKIRGSWDRYENTVHNNQSLSGSIIFMCCWKEQQHKPYKD